MFKLKAIKRIPLYDTHRTFLWW